MKLYFELKKISHNEAKVRAIIMDHPLRTAIQIRSSIDPKEWENGFISPKAKGIAKQVRGVMNDYIEAFDKYIAQCIRDNESVSPIDVKQHILEVVSSNNNPTNKPKIHTPITLIDSYIKDRKGIKKDSSLKPFNTLRGHLVEFNRNITFKQLNSTFFDDFKKYLGGKNIQNATSNKLLIAFKVVLKWGYKKKIHQNDSYTDITHLKTVDQRIVSITKDELRIYMNADLPDHLAKARSIFCFACFTGLRLSDLKQVNTAIVNDNGMIVLNNIKTNNEVSIQLNKYCLSVLDSYGGVLPFTISDQKINDNIKAGLKRLELNRVVGINQHIMNDLKTIYKPLHEVISMHSARRTFISLSVDGGLGTFEIMTKSGHKNIRSLQRYVNVNQKDIDAKLNNIFNMD